MPRTQLIHNQAGTLEFYVPQGVPSAATLTLYTEGDATFSGETWPLDVAPSASTTTDAQLAENSGYALSVASVVGFVRTQRYMVVLPTGEPKEIRLRGIDTSSSDLVLDELLDFAIPSGSTVASHRLTYTLNASQTATKRRRCRAVWSYTVDGVAHVHQEFFDIVREPFVIPITEEDIEKHDASFGENAGDAQRWKKLIPGAHDEIERKLRAMQIDPDEIRDRDAIKDALIFSILAKASMKQPLVSKGWKDMRDEALKDFQEARSWIDSDDDGRVDGVDTDNDHSDGIFYDNDRDPWSQGGSELGTPVKYMRVG